MIKIRWPVALAGLFVSLLAWYVFYSQSLVDTLEEDSEVITSMFAMLQEAIQDTAGTDESLFNMQGRLIDAGLPLVIIDGDSAIWAENIELEAPLETARGQREALDFVRSVEDRYDYIAGVVPSQRIYYGDPPAIRRLRWQPYLLAGGLLITTAIGFLVIRHQRRAESEKAWTAMARELAHQLGTPISSLQGWLELLKLPPEERMGVDSAEVSHGIEEDLERLERISRRFELVGREPTLEAIDLREVVRALEVYLQARLPRLAKGVSLKVDVPGDLPPVMGNDVLLTWALENVVKNALDALAGRGGEIRIGARPGPPGYVELTVADTGPGVPLELRDRLFEPGISGKSHGWGVGLTLSRRIIEGVHNGRIGLLEGAERGATFEVRLPTART